MGKYIKIIACFCILLVLASCTGIRNGNATNIDIKNMDASQDYFVFISNKSSLFSTEKKYGYMNSKGEVIISPYFEYAEDFVDGMAKVKKGEGYGVLDKKGQYILQPIYSDCKLLGNGLIAYKTQRWRIKNTEGKEVGNLEFDDINSFSEGLAAVKVGNKWGFINADGELKIEPAYDFVGSFKNSLCDIKLNNRWGLIDNSGNEVVKPDFEDRLQVLDDYILVRDKDGKWGYLNSKGEQVIEYVFEKAGNFSEGLAPVYAEGKWGYIDKQGNFAIEPAFDEAEKFVKGSALVRKDGKAYFIDKDGMAVKEADIYYTDIYDFCEQMAAVKVDGKYGFINENMELAVEAEFDDYKDFSEGFAVVGKKISGSYDTVYGFVDKSGNWLVEPSFTNAESFKDGLARVWKSGKMGYIDTKGNLVYKTW